DLSDTAGANTEAIYTSDGITANSTQLEQLKKLFPACFDADGNSLSTDYKPKLRHRPTSDANFTK
ncbi:TPA: hypothetical protein WIU39_001944, partial [Neisseria meningitidis]